MLQIIDLVKKYGRDLAVDHLNLTIGEGEIFGFVGPNGAGKTTTMKIISGLLQPTSGTVLIKGMDVTAHPARLKEKIGYMPDFFGVYDALRVDEYLDFYAGTYRIPYDQREEMIRNLLELVDLSHKREAYVDTLSRGMKQRLCLARSLVHDPDILLLDEPASGLDPRARVEMKEVLKQLKTLGKTIIISSHILPELAELCTVIGIIDKGNLVANGSVQDIMRQLNYRRTIKAKPLDNIDGLIRFLEEQPSVCNVIEKTEDVEFDFEGDDQQLSNLLSGMIRENISIIHFVEKEGDLEDIFMELTKGGEQL